MAGWLAAFWNILVFATSAFKMLRAYGQAPRKKGGKQQRSGTLINSRDTGFIYPFLYGPGRGGGNIEYEAISGNDNKYLHRIIICGWGPIEGVYREDGSIFTTEWTALPKTPGSNPALVYFDGKLWTETNKYGKIHIEFFRGSSDQVCCATLNSALAEFTDTYRDKFGIYVRYEYTPGVLEIPPVVTVKWAGLRCYDPYSGTTAYTQNFALHAYDLMTRPKELGGIGLDAWMELYDAGDDYISQPGNLVPDPTFDRTTAVDDDTYWRMVEGAWGADYGVDGGPGYRLNVNGDGTAAELWPRDQHVGGWIYLPVSTGDKIYFRATVKSDSDFDAIARFCIWQFDADKVSLSSNPAYNFTSSLIVDTWVDVSGSITAFHADVAFVYIGIYTFAGTQGYLYIDNFWVGKNPPGARIDIASVESCRAYCAAKGWEGGFWLTDDIDFVQSLSVPLACFRGDVIGSAGTFAMMFRDLNYETVKMELTEQDVVINEDGTTTLDLKPRNRWRQLTNTLKITHYSEDLNYQEHEYTHQPETALSGDDGRIREKRVDLLGLNTTDKLQQMGNYLIERDRWGFAGPFKGSNRCVQLEGGDLIKLTHPLPGYTDQYLRVTGNQYNGMGGPLVTVEEEAAALYDDDYNTSALERYVPSNIDLTDEPPSVYNLSISEDTRATRTRTGTWLLVDFDPPDNYPYFRGAKVWLRIGAAGSWKYMAEVKSDYEYGPVQEGVEYYFKLQAVNFLNKEEEFDSAPTISSEVVGLLEDLPADPSGMTAAAIGDGVSVRANNPGYDDILGWEVRFGAAWTGGIFMSLLNDPSYSLGGVRPGTHTFWLAIKNNAGNYSENPASATCKVSIPGWLTSEFSQAYDYTTGTHSNTAHDTYGGSDVLKCSHTSGVLTGTWTSPTYDMGSLKTVRIWVEFLTVFLAGSSTWDGVIPSPATWNDIDISTKTWDQIFQPAEAAQLVSKLYYSENGSDWSEVGFFQILFAEVYARYFKFDLQITDPSADANLYIYASTLKAYTGPI